MNFNTSHYDVLQAMNNNVPKSNKLTIINHDMKLNKKSKKDLITSLRYGKFNELSYDVQRKAEE